MSAWCFALKATSEHHYVDVDYNSVLPVTCRRPSDVQSMLCC